MFSGCTRIQLLHLPDGLKSFWIQYSFLFCHIVSQFSFTLNQPKPMWKFIAIFPFNSIHFFFYSFYVSCFRFTCSFQYATLFTCSIASFDYKTLFQFHSIWFSGLVAFNSLWVFFFQYLVYCKIDIILRLHFSSSFNEKLC